MPKSKVRSIFSSRHYSTSSSNSYLSDLPIPVLTLNNLNNPDFIQSYRKLLKDKGGIYSFINMENGNQYIGSAKDFYLRLNEHLKNKKSNIALQSAFLKYGLDKFEFGIYEYFTYESKIVSSYEKKKNFFFLMNIPSGEVLKLWRT